MPHFTLWGEESDEEEEQQQCLKKAVPTPQTIPFPSEKKAAEPVFKPLPVLEGNAGSPAFAESFKDSKYGSPAYFNQAREDIVMKHAQ